MYVPRVDMTFSNWIDKAKVYRVAREITARRGRIHNVSKKRFPELNKPERTALRRIKRAQFKLLSLEHHNGN